MPVIKKIFAIVLSVLLSTNAAQVESVQAEGEHEASTQSFWEQAEQASPPSFWAAAAQTEHPVAGEITQEEKNMTIPSLYVDGTTLKTENGMPIQLRGVSTHGIAWYPQYINKEFFAQLKEMGANVIRLAMYTAEDDGYCTGGDQAAQKQLIDQGVQIATELDMYVMIDWHILSDNNPWDHAEQAKAFFEEMSKLYGDHTNVLYEICNEPNGGTTWADVKAYAESVIPIIRANDPDSVIIVGTPNWSQDVDLAAQDPIKGYDNIMYTLHFYAASHKEALQQKMQTALQMGLPIFVTEFGICDASGNGGLDLDEADKWISLLDKAGISYIQWNISNKAESSAFFKPSCTKASGFTQEDFNSSGVWMMKMLGH